jgi:hypothetical protein
MDYFLQQVFNAKQGWKPLCDFLEVPIPDVPFPHVYDTKVYNAMMKK